MKLSENILSLLVVPILSRQGGAPGVPIPLQCWTRVIRRSFLRYLSHDSLEPIPVVERMEVVMAGVTLLSDPDLFSWSAELHTDVVVWSLRRTDAAHDTPDTSGESLAMFVK